MQILVFSRLESFAQTSCLPVILVIIFVHNTSLKSDITKKINFCYE